MSAAEWNRLPKKGRPTLAHDARGIVEDALGADVRNWKWSLALSRWLDCLLVLSEAA